MKLLTALAIAAASGGVCAAPAFAQGDTAAAPAAPEAPKQSTSGFYAGAGINLYFLDRDFAASGQPFTFEDQPSPGAFMGKLGYSFNEYIAVEIEAGVGGARSEFSFSGNSSDGEIGIDSPLGAHLVLTMPVSNGVYLMGKAGYVSAKVSRELFDVDQGSLDVKGAAFGVGAGLRAGNWDYRMDYSIMSGGDSGDGGVLGMAALYHF